MSNPHKPWARIDSRLQRQLGHYAYYGMPADTPRAAIHTLIGTPYRSTIPSSPHFQTISEAFPDKTEWVYGVTPTSNY